MILFLDFDGVLHPDAVYLRHGRPTLVYTRQPGASLFMWSEHLVDILAQHPQVRIVLSTSWARHLGFSRAKKRLPAVLRERCIGATWHSAMRGGGGMYGRTFSTWWDSSTRYQQIARYVERAGLQEWLAVDDDDEGWPESMRHRLVHMDAEFGLGVPEKQQELLERLR